MQRWYPCHSIYRLVREKLSYCLIRGNFSYLVTLVYDIEHKDILETKFCLKELSLSFEKNTDVCAVLNFLFIAWTGFSFIWAQKLNKMHPLQIFLSSATLAGWNQEPWKERLQASSLAHGGLRLGLEACIDCQELCHWHRTKAWPQDAFVYQWLLESCVWED